MFFQDQSCLPWWQADGVLFRTSSQSWLPAALQSTSQCSYFLYHSLLQFRKPNLSFLISLWFLVHWFGSTAAKPLNGFLLKTCFCCIYFQKMLMEILTQRLSLRLKIAADKTNNRMVPLLASMRKEMPLYLSWHSVLTVNWSDWHVVSYYCKLKRYVIGTYTLYLLFKTLFKWRSQNDLPIYILNFPFFNVVRLLNCISRVSRSVPSLLSWETARQSIGIS